MNTTRITTEPGRAYKYRGFISYSHAADDGLAQALQSALHRYTKPWYRLRAMRVFRDKTGLAVTPELWGSIQAALAESEYFILLAAPGAAQSQWVEQEIDWWLRHRSVDRLLIVWTDGELIWDRAAGDFDWARTTALPRRLEKAFAGEPNHLDLRFAKTSAHLSLRQPQFLEAVASLSATLQGRALDEMIGEDIRQHRKTLRWLRAAGAGLAGLAIAAGVAVFVARQAWITAGKVAEGIEDAAKKQQRQALSREAAARSLAVLDTDRELAILLAVEAAQAHATAEALSALRQALFESSAPILTLSGHSGGAYAARFTPDGRRVVTGGADQVVRVWEADSGTAALELHGHTGGVTSAEISSDGKRICTSSRDDQTARVWEADTGRNLFAIDLEGLSYAEFSPGGRLILTVADQGDAVLWEAASGRRLDPLASPYARMRGASWVLSAGFSPDGSRVALVDWHPYVYDIATGKPLFELEGHSKWVRDIGYSPDGQWLVTASEDHTARVWRAASGKSIAVLNHDEQVIVAAFGPGGRWMLTRTAGDRVLRIWETGTWKHVAGIDVRPGVLAGFASSPDGEFILTFSDAPDAAVFETGTGARVAELIGHADQVIAVDFSPDSRRIVTAGLDGRVLLYDFRIGGTTAELIALARQRVSRDFSAEERARHLPPAPR